MKNVIAVCMFMLIAGCAAVPKAKPVAKPVELRVISVLELSECGKPKAFFAITNDGTIHPADADDLSKDQIAGIEALAGTLPEGNAGEVALPCVPSQKTRL